MADEKKDRPYNAIEEMATLEGMPLDYAALFAAARAVLECPDYRGISTHEMRTLRAAVEAIESYRHRGL